jgi:hypothetical protein
MEFTDSVEIKKSPETVFRFISDIDNLDELQSSAELEQVTEGPVAVGTQFRELENHHLTGDHQALSTVTKYEPAQEFAVELRDGDDCLHCDWTLSGQEKTTLTYTVHLKTKSFLPWNKYLLKRMIERRFAKNHQLIKERLESQS